MLAITTDVIAKLDLAIHHFKNVLIRIGDTSSPGHDTCENRED